MLPARALAPLFAWIMVQVPLMVCDSACSHTIDAVFFAGLHSCHDESSGAHRSRCASGDEHADHDHEGCDEPEEPGAPGESQGDHGVVHVSSVAAGEHVRAPAGDRPFGLSQALPIAAQPVRVNDQGPWARNADPPPTLDRAPLSDRLRV